MKNRHGCKIKLSILCVFILHTTLAYGQTPSTLEELFTKLNSQTYPLTAFEKALLDLNISRAYSYDERGMHASSISWNPTKAKLQTSYFVQSNSPFFKMSSKEQLKQLEVAINGLRLNILSVFGGIDRIDELWTEIGKILDVDFKTVEDDKFYIIGRFTNGQATLVREEIPLPQSFRFGEKLKK